MNIHILKAVFLFLAFTLSTLFSYFYFNSPNHENKIDKKFIPGDWFYEQRAYPYDNIPVDKFFRVQKEKQNFISSNMQFANNTWYPVGPSNIGGRITALDYDPINNFLYAAAAAGGVFKSTDYGITWSPKTDFFPSLSVGAIKIDPVNPAVIYCGTGEANISTDSYSGFGILKSTDYGETWFVSGLEESRHIGKIEIHPLNSNLIYSAVSGGLYSKGPDRGIYKSTDAGNTWEHVLYLNDSTSAIDVDVDPSDTNIIYAAMWERLRGPTFRKAAGINSGIYKSTNGGESWSQLLTGLPSPDPIIGRISIAVARSNPDYVYALYKQAEAPNGTSNFFMGFYRSTNKGETWTHLPSGTLSSAFSSFGWYFGLLEVDPNDHNLVYCADIDLFKSVNGGSSWQNITNSYSGSFDEQHPDQHALWIDPANPNKLIVGNDGGIFTSLNGSAPWTKAYDLPVSQFYASEIDFLQPEIKLGGTQDNGTLKSGGDIDNWNFIYGGDGFHTKVDYTNSNIIYAEYQFGGIGKSTNGGQNFSYIGNGIDFSRTNWSTPYILDIQNPNILYFGTYKLHRTTNGGSNWTEISPDLTRGPNGRLGTITCISSAVESDNTTRVIYVGTDDAKISVSTNSGVNWEDRTGILPQRYITDVLSDKRDPATAYVTLSGYNLDETNPHVFRTTDYGINWSDISGNLPDIPVNSIIIDYDKDSILYIGTDAGAFYTEDLGISWEIIGSGLPNSPVFDLNYHQPTKKLVAATHGRSLFEFDLSFLTTISEEENFVIDNFVLYQNYPNPFNPTTTISWQSPVGSHQTIKIYDLLGREVEVLVDEYRPAGSYKVEFDGSNLTSGVYIYNLSGSGFNSAKKLVLIR